MSSGFHTINTTTVLVEVEQTVFIVDTSTEIRLILTPL